MSSLRADLWSWKSWIDSANEPGNGFPLQNLPYCAFRGADGGARIGAAIGEWILDLRQCAVSGLLEGLFENVEAACRQPELNGLVECGPLGWSALRRRLLDLLKTDSADEYRRERGRVEAALLPANSVSFLRPVRVTNFTDFYASIHHAINVGRLFRPDQPLLPNYKFVPVGYHGRASSIVVSGTGIRRPKGQTKAAGGGAPQFGPSARLDYEVEVGAYVGLGNSLGEPIFMEFAERHLFGISLLNDWSARDIQAWEYQPLGPFLAKSFATSVSPFVVPMAALEPFRVPVQARPPGDPEPLPYLTPDRWRKKSAMDIKLEALLSSREMRRQGLPPMKLSSGNLCDLYWTFAQMVVHHSSNGCNLVPGDLLASGTVSGAQAETQGCLLEITRGGAQPVHLPTGETRTFLEDEDEVILRGCCEREGFPRVSLGECRGVILPPAKSAF